MIHIALIVGAQILQRRVQQEKSFGDSSEEEGPDGEQPGC